MIDNPLSYILIRPNVINEYGLKELRQHIEQTNKTDLSVFDPHKSNETGGKEWIVNKKIRDTQHVEAGPTFPKIIDLFRNMSDFWVAPLARAWNPPPEQKNGS